MLLKSIKKIKGAEGLLGPKPAGRPSRAALPRACGFEPARQGPQVSETTPPGDVELTQGTWPAAISATAPPKSSTPEFLVCTNSNSTTRATSETWLRNTGRPHACRRRATAAAEHGRGANDDFRSDRRRGDVWEAAMLTLGAMETTARTGAACACRNWSRRSSGPEEGNRAAMAEKGLPPRFLPRG